MKKSFKNILIYIIITILLITLSGCNTNKSKLSLNDKVKEELLYLDTEIISLINSLNNITIENYKIDTKEITLRGFII